MTIAIIYLLEVATAQHCVFLPLFPIASDYNYTQPTSQFASLESTTHMSTSCTQYNTIILFGVKSPWRRFCWCKCCSPSATCIAIWRTCFQVTLEDPSINWARLGPSTSSETIQKGSRHAPYVRAIFLWKQDLRCQCCSMINTVTYCCSHLDVLQQAHPV